MKAQDKTVDEVMQAKIREALEDDRPDIPAADVFAELRTYHAEKLKTGDDAQSPAS